ncbi:MULTISPECIES: pyruvate dehydrogenase [Streptomycetaceae]|uniref:Thiamine pyrophosphate protein domain protein TPP-binding protein n=1 Tax=Streptantibioticus cattleyicolor (strain ATCC 35852 / DSM 46488 / JCM 4925 / NBRC 14057 / NRRL 8057) TaxID=1003195 RepID=F8K2Y9_STREN|nr:MULTISPECIES: pyruvate dehydrogenase [Streptomycetaceae]AEW92477.1 thiamine pyrophosphate protein domain protein TPP-binding protein [Streptantibioticus cattleyicolor NRRL 8057 = DSM 46488]MYS57281.1 pyruvate dehydrogenase [Streptomyces sp. SID5468]CCB72838.1 Pyruvate dehydrogenase [cytochrome] [Streptantibioticus cattleyicolor NRRL 8057 = DSM 46488]
MANPTVAQQFTQILRQAGVERVYGVVGDSLNPVVDAVRRTEGIEWVHVRNEEAAAFAAAAQAQLTGELAVCAGSCGPGNTHLIQGLYDANRSGAPVLALASHIPAKQIGTGFFQETHPERLFTECSRYCELISSPAQMPRVLRIALQRAIGHQGVSVVVLPGDLAHAESGYPTGTSDLVTGLGRVLPPEDQVTALARKLDEAATVTLFCGAGVRGAHEEVMRLADRVHAPVGHSLRGKEWIQYDNPFDVGMSGLLGYGACYDAIHEADLVVLLGTDFPYDDFLPQARTVQIDHDAGRLGARTALELGVHGDVRETLRAVLPLVRAKTDRSFLDRMLRRHARALENVVGAYTRNVERHVPIHPEFPAAVLDELAADDAVFTVDTGMCNVWAARYITPNGRRRVIGSFLHGTMANALPHAIGAQFADRGRQVISLSGDGGLGMLMGELLTVRLHDLPVKTIVFNNSSLGMVKLEMMVDGLRDYQTDHAPVDYSAIARAAGIHAIRAERPGQVRDALAEGLAHDGPALVELVTDPNALSMPPHLSAGQVKGFAFSAGRTVLDGGVGRMLDLARANLRNIPRP